MLLINKKIHNIVLCCNDYLNHYSLDINLVSMNCIRVIDSKKFGGTKLPFLGITGVVPSKVLPLVFNLLP